MITSFLRRAALALSLLALASTARALDASDAEDIPLKNPGFEEPYTVMPGVAAGAKAQITGALADGWSDNSNWANLAFDYSADKANPHGGETAQKVQITRVTEGALQFTQAVPFKRSHQYKFSVWLRGEPGAEVTLMIRQAGAPYTTYAQVPVTLTTDWREYSIGGVVPDDTAGMLLIFANKPMTFWIDDAKFTDRGDTKGVVPVTLRNPSFEDPYKDLPPLNPAKKGLVTGQIASGWGDNSDWADVEVAYSKDTTSPHSGEASQHIDVKRVSGGAVQFVQDVDFNKGAYAWNVWLRGTPGTTVNLILRRMDPATQYAAATVTLSAEWREFTVSGEIPEKAHGFLMIIARGPTSFSVDDARLDDLTNANADGPPRVGNLIISGGSFEAGLPFGWRVAYSGNMGNRFRDLRAAFDDTTATAGTRSLEVEIPSGDNAEVSSPMFPFNINRPHTVSLDLKSSVPNTSVQVGFEGAENPANFSVGTEWKRYTFTAKPPYRPFARLDLRSSSPDGEPARTVWIDAVQVEEAATASAYQAPFPHEVSLTLARPGHVVFDGEIETVGLAIAPAPPEGAKLKLSATDLYGKTRPVDAVALPATSFPLPDFQDNSRGLFKLKAELVDKDGKAIGAPTEMVWARLPKPREIDPAKSFFGIHIPLTKDFIDIARATGHRWTRLHDSSMIGKWAIAEPKQGTFEYHDEGVSAAHDGGMAILGLLDGAPPWASKKPRAATGYWSVWNIPDGTANWENYVRNVVGHYKGRIDAWELWNEPWGEWWTGAGGTPEGYTELLKVAYKTAKEVNPDVTIVGIDTYRGNTWTEKALAAAGLDNMDAFSFHDYNEALYGGPNSQAQQDVKQYNDAQAKHGTPKPLWNTEGGPGIMGSFYIPEAGGLGPRQQLAQAVRFDVTSMGAGVKAFFLYAIHRESPMGPGNYNALEHDRSIRAVLAARAVLASLVDGAKCLGRTEPAKGVDAYDFEQADGQKITVLWSYTGEPVEMTPPAGAKALDVLGNPLPAGPVKVGVEPIYFVR